MNATAGLRRPSMVVFDLDDTLYEYEPCDRAGRAAMVRLGASETGLPEADFDAALQAARAVVKDRLGATGSSHSRLLYAHEALAGLGFGNQLRLALNLEQEFWRTYILSMQVRPGAGELLTALRYQHVRVAIVTDLTTQIQFRKLVHLGLDSIVDDVVTSEECVGDKATLAPFRVLAARTTAARRQHVWFVGDRPSDAPLEQLVAEGIIESGHGWLLGDATGPGRSSWTDLGEIETAFTRTT